MRKPNIVLVAALATCGLVLGLAPRAGAQSTGYDYEHGYSDWLARYDRNDSRRYGYARPFFGYRYRTWLGGVLFTRESEVQPEYPYSGDRVVADVQSQLTNRGYRVGPVDGVLGGQTRSAIAAFRSRTGLPQSGDIDVPLLRALLLL